MNKLDRQAKITHIINNESISNQDELMDKLKQYYDINAAQTTISRDIHEMNIIKNKTNDGRFKYTIYDSDNNDYDLQDQLNNMIYNVVTSLTRIQFINIIHTLSNDANRLAALIDELTNKNIAGTLAGHDTIVIFSPDNTSAKSVENMINMYVKKD